MATVSAKVFEHHKKADGTYNVRICIHHKNQRKYLDTNHFVVKKQLTKDYKVKDPFIADKVEQLLRDYRKIISELDDRLDYFTAESLRDYLRDKDEDVDFIKFCDQHIERLRKEGRNGTANNHRKIRNSLVDYFNRTSVSIKEINSNMLMAYERYMRSERTMIRINQMGNKVTTKEKGLSDSGLHNQMRDLRTLFNAARDQYNNEDLGIYRIKHYPFKKYKVGSPPLTKKRNNTLEQVLTIRDCVIMKAIKSLIHITGPPLQVVKFTLSSLILLICKHALHLKKQRFWYMQDFLLRYLQVVFLYVRFSFLNPLPTKQLATEQPHPVGEWPCRGRKKVTTPFFYQQTNTDVL